MRFIHQLENLVIVGIAYFVALVSTFTLMSPEGTMFAGVGTKMTAAPPSRLKILLSHRPEYSGEYAKHNFDLVFSGHLHGGQWRLPGLGLGVYGPSAGGPHVGERHLFPRRTGGVYPLNANTAMVVSRGLARESTPIPRFFNHPELVVVDLREN